MWCKWSWFSQTYLKTLKKTYINKQKRTSRHWLNTWWMCLDCQLWKNHYLITVWSCNIQGASQLLHDWQTALGNLREFESILSLCSDAPIIFNLSRFTPLSYSNMTTRKRVSANTELCTSDWLIKTSNKAVCQPTLNYTCNNIIFKWWTHSVSAVCFQKCMNFKYSTRIQCGSSSRNADLN